MGIVGSIFQGILGSNAASKTATVEANASTHAADLQKQAADQALAFNKQQYGNSLNLLSPFYNTGVSANSRLASLMGLNPAQGLPAGVINPNANPTSAGGGLPGNPTPNMRGLQPQNGAPVNRLAQFPSEDSGAMGMLNPQSAPGAPSNATQLQMRPPITSGGAAGMLNPDGSTGADFTPGQQTLGLNQNPSPNVTNATTNQGGTGQVPRTDGGGDPQVLGDGSIEQQLFQGGGPGNFGGGGNTGGFGSLAQGWNQTFQSPNAVTEQNDPGYQFRLQQGNQALQNSAAARGGLLSGGTAKALTDYNQNAASGEYGNVYNRALQNYNTNYNTFTNDQTNLFNRLMALQSGGQVSANNLSSAGVNAANTNANIGLSSAGQIGDSLQNAANATGSGYINQTNAINGAFKSGTNSLASLLAMFGGG